MKTLISLFVVSIFCINGIIAQKAESLNVKDSIPLDPALKKAVLKNGLTYYLKHDDNLGDKISLHFAVKAGEMHEEKDQIELAHLLEHLAVSSTRNFPDVRSFLQSNNLVLGKECNASTGGLKTTYQITIPSNDTVLLRNCLLLINDWVSGGINLNADRIDPERGVILQEKNRRNSSFSMVRTKSMAEVLRLPKGNRMDAQIDDNVKNFKPASLQQFYHDWYTPDNAALIVVGKINKESLEGAITNLFAGIRGASKKISNIYKPPYTINHDSRYIGFSAKDYSNVDCKIYFKVPYQPFTTYEDVKRNLRNRVVEDLISFRFKNMQEGGSAIGISCEYIPILSEYTKPMGSFILSTYDAKDSLKQVFHKMIYEIHRLKRTGFNNWELDSAKNRTIANIEEEERESSAANDCLEDYLQGIPMADPKIKLIYSKALLSQITIVELNEIIKNFSFDKNSDIVIVTPESKSQILPTQADVNDWLKKVSTETIAPFVIKGKIVPKVKPEYFPELMTKQQLSKLETAKPIVIKKEKLELIDAAEIKLANGITVIIKRTEDKDGKIYVNGFNRSDVFPKYNSESLSANYLGWIVGGSGIGPFTAENWDRYKHKEGIMFHSSVKDSYSIFSGESSEKQLEKLFQIIYLSLVQPKADTLALKAWKTVKIRDINRITNTTDPDQIYSNAILSHFRLRDDVYLKVSDLDAVDSKRTLSIYKDVFANKGKWTFVITGTSDSLTIQHLIKKYLGAVPLEKNTGDNNYSSSDKPFFKPAFYQENNAATQSSRVSVYLPGNVKNFPGISFYAQILQYQLHTRMVDRLRVKEGLSYSPRELVYPNNNFNNMSYLAGVFFDCNPEKIDYAIQCVKEEFIKLQQDSIQSVMLEEVKKNVLLNFSQQTKDGLFWNNYFSDAITQQMDVESIANYPELIKNITPASMAAFVSSFSIDSCSTFVLNPKGKNPQQQPGTVSNNTDSVALMLKVVEYKKKKDYEAMSKTYCEFYEKFGSKDGPSDLNGVAWVVFSYSSDLQEMNKAITWVKLAIEKSDEDRKGRYLDTYANLLYKLGRKEEALAVQKTATETIIDRKIVDLGNTYYKMLSGQPTWKFPKVEYATNYSKDLWKQLTPALSRFPKFQQDSIIAHTKMLYAKDIGNEKYPAFLITYFEKYLTEKDANIINNYAWEIFLYSHDKKQLNKAISWSRDAINEQNISSFLDTHANLLYKIGKKEKAVSYMKQAIEKSPADKRASFTATLQKMERGEKTWTF